MENRHPKIGQIYKHKASGKYFKLTSYTYSGMGPKEYYLWQYPDRTDIIQCRQKDLQGKIFILDKTATLLYGN